jgi:nucleoid-associated protein EbfC
LADQNNYSQLQKRVASELVRLEAELSRKSAEATAGGGLIRVKVDGHKAIRQLTIDPSLFDGRDPDLLADLIMSAVAEAQRRVSDIPDETPITALDLEPGNE